MLLDFDVQQPHTTRLTPGVIRLCLIYLYVATSRKTHKTTQAPLLCAHHRVTDPRSAPPHLSHSKTCTSSDCALSLSSPSCHVSSPSHTGRPLPPNSTTYYPHPPPSLLSQAVPLRHPSLRNHLAWVSVLCGLYHELTLYVCYLTFPECIHSINLAQIWRCQSFTIRCAYSH